MAKVRVKKKKIDFKKIQPTQVKVLTKKVTPIIVIIVLFVVGHLSLKNLPYFKLESVQINDITNASGLDAKELARLYVGRNIFDIDINSLSSMIKHDHPTIKDVKVKRILPNKLEIDIVPRIAIAKIKSYAYFPVDRSGMILSPEIKSGKLPVISGLSIWLRPRVGERLKNKQLDIAFSLMDAFKNMPGVQSYHLSSIDVSNYKNVSFYIDDNIEVKIGGEDFQKRLKALEKTLKNPELDRRNIKYIDLRFKDVVIGPR